MNFYLTTPIYYVNDRPHIGHAYTSVACDVLARYKRLSGANVKFLTGTDEHGQKIEKAATAAGLTPQAMADANSQHFRDMARLMNISNDDFIRTTEPRHIASAQALWKKMEAGGHIYLDSYKGWYSVRDEAYYQESELVDGKAPTGADVEWVEEPSYFFRLSSFHEKLLEYYAAHPGFIGPESRRNEVTSFVKGGLKDLSISRTTFSWGIKVPGNEKHVMYVWLDALANYLSALGYPDNTPDINDFWPADLHLVGKDILRFHTVYWPAFLMAAQLPVPKRVFAHGWWTIEGEKMSKSLGNAIAPQNLVSEFGLDQTRWFLMREVPFGNDGNFSRERMIQVINSELANNIGNLVQRTLTMIHKNAEGKVPAAAIISIPCQDILEYYNNNMNNINFTIAGEGIITLANRCNAFIDVQAPWKLKKEDPEKMLSVLYSIAETIRKISIILYPFMPESSSKILALLAVPEDQRTLDHLSGSYALKPGTPLPPPEPVFPRFMEKAASPSGA
ncbi:MAG: methionine--tRNA ligase [Pseudomonadota bacterium]|nr:methionine--tRNA ligase [Pseudomonadota bacterium]MDE3037917.1 methionine--tRNA ligase [Pseudomonadota bacterium]